MQSSSTGVQVQFTVTIPAIEPQALQFDPDADSGSDRMELGRGGFGIVYAGHYQGQPVAIKTLHVTTAKVVKALYEEAAVMFRTASPYTVKLQGICSTAKVTSLVMERMTGGSLFHLLQDETKELPWVLRYRLAYEIAEGLWALHAQEILHRDLKSMNVLLDDEQHAKLTDFGFSRLRGQITSVAASSKHSLGTPAYKSPELVEQDLADSDSDSDEEKATKVKSTKKANPYSPYSDVYAYGVILWELATRKVPFADQEPIKVYKKIAKGKHEKIPEDCPPEFAALIKACWAMKPGKRPKTDELVKQIKALYETAMAASLAEQNQGAAGEEKEHVYTPESWHVHPAVRAEADKEVAATGKLYTLLPAGDYDIQKVVSSYQLCPVPGQSIKNVQVIYNPRLNRAFGLMLDTLSARHNKSAFKAHWREKKENVDHVPKEDQGQVQWEERVPWRETTHQLLEALAKPHQDTNHPHVKLVPMWHVTNAKVLPDLFETGFASLALLDAGYFGKGIYSAGEARYSQTVYGKFHATPALLVNWVAIYSAYPVIDGDMEKLKGKGNYSNYDAHFIPVRPATKDPNETDFYPCRIGEKATYTEMVVFQSAQCLPRYVVELQSDLLMTPQEILDAKLKQQTEQAQKAKTKQQSEAAEKELAAQQALQAEEAAKAQAKIKAKAEQAEKTKAEEAEKRRAAEEVKDDEDKTEGRVKTYSPIWQPAYGKFWKPKMQTPPQVAQFLRLIAEGEQDKAEAMLKANSNLTLQSGTVTDLSNRTFEHITAFQYAVWARDWHMWTMLLKYLSEEEATLQLHSLETNGTEHGTQFDFGTLIGAISR